MRQEIQHQPVELVGMLPLRPMAATVEDVQFGIGHAPEQAQADVERDEAVVAPPDDEGWGGDFTEARAMHIHFEEVLLVSAKLPGFSFRKESLRRVDLSGADVRKGDFRMTVFEDCSLREAMVTGSRFEGSDLRGADLGGLRLVDAGLFRGATISREQAGQLLGELGLNVR